MKGRARAGLWIRLILILTLTGLSPTSGVPTIHANTKVSGAIISYTIWAAAHSLYIVVESVKVWEGVTLTIEPGVTVRFDNGKKLQVNGGLIQLCSQNPGVI